MLDYLPAFCRDCGTNVSVMVDQNSTPALVCACPRGTYRLDGTETGEWLDGRIQPPDFAEGE